MNLRVLSFSCTVLACGPPAVADYIDSVLNDNPVAYYRLNESSGTSAVDSAGGNTGTYQAGVTQGTAGPRPVDGFSGFATTNNAPTFAGGAGPFITMPAGFLPTGGNPRTIEGWFFDTGSAIQTYFNYGNPTAAGRRITLTATNGEVSVAAGGHRYGKSGLGLAAGWHHLAVTLPNHLNNSNRFNLYVDGQELTGLTSLAGSNQTVNTTDANRRIGRDSGTGTYNGQIDEIAVYDRELSAGDVNRHFLSAQGKGFTRSDFSLSEFTTAEADGDSPANSSSFAGAQLFVRERSNTGETNLRTRAFVKFDLSTLDPALIQSATLNLHEFNKLNSVYSGNLTIARVLSDWNASGSNDPIFGDAVADAFIFGTNGRNTAGAAVDIDHVIDVTDIVKYWYENPSENFGFRLSLNFNNTGAAFDHTGADAPLLVIYQFSVPEPSAFALTTLGLLLLSGLAWRRRRF